MELDVEIVTEHPCTIQSRPVIRIQYKLEISVVFQLQKVSFYQITSCILLEPWPCVTNWEYYIYFIIHKSDGHIAYEHFNYGNL